MTGYLSGISHEVTEEDVQKTFEGSGRIEAVKIIKDHHSGRLKGFGFAEMPNDADAQSAINTANHKECKDEH
jgi:RNA recognition motif-containing protein